MPRLVKHLRQEPYAVTIGGETQYICACGLSAHLPFCDGSHANTADEDPEKLYWYDAGLERYEVPEPSSMIPSEA